MPITQEMLENVTTIVCHENGPGNPCPDGVASALILRDALPSAEIMFANHQLLKTLHKAPPGYLFCDITPAREHAHFWNEAGAIVLDHHKESRDIIEVFGERGIYGNEPGLSGAGLAFQHVWRDMNKDRFWQIQIAVAEFAKLAGIRDTWQKDHPAWRKACEQAEALRFWPWEKWPIDPFEGAGSDSFVSLFDIGEVLYEKRLKSAQDLVKRAYHTTIEDDERDVTVSIIPSLETSDVAELIDVDVLVGFGYVKLPCTVPAPCDDDCLPSMQLSFRTRKPDINVGALATKLGGGGHRAAAGATVDLGGEHAYYEIIAHIRDHVSAITLAT